MGETQSGNNTTCLVDDKGVRISFEYGESASDETERDHDESPIRVTTPKDLEHLWDAELRYPMREPEIGACEGTLSTGGDVTAILKGGDARGEPSVIDRTGLFQSRNCGGRG